MAITGQQLVRDFTQLLKTRGLRLAALGGTGSDHYKVYLHPVGASALTAPSAGHTRIVFDFDQTILDAMGEKASGAENSVIPIPDRV